ncbi:hypothetical protein NDN13_05325 [Acinetobacter sp. C32I]|uniref:hypothetical protein n=1 Tax=Acinetobacter sp. C32I TaxID=2950074 RepID=UPI002037204E|nr:hypothetical protein [Acinetobacter sp. C32I]USA54615.1 hypothetical protein NDN13_05325 [Acinetobacter sp. C32I]
MTFPKSPHELKNLGTAKHQFIVNKDIASVEKNIDAFLNKCYNTKNKAKIVLDHVRLGPDMGFEKMQSLNKIEYSVYIGLDPKLYSLGIDVINLNESKNVKVDVVAVTSMWKRVFPRLERAANGSDESCPM